MRFWKHLFARFVRKSSPLCFAVLARSCPIPWPCVCQPVLPVNCQLLQTFVLAPLFPPSHGPMLMPLTRSPLAISRNIAQAVAQVACSEPPARKAHTNATDVNRNANKQHVKRATHVRARGARVTRQMARQQSSNGTRNNATNVNLHTNIQLAECPSNACRLVAVSCALRALPFAGPPCRSCLPTWRHSRGRPRGPQFSPVGPARAALSPPGLPGGQDSRSYARISSLSGSRYLTPRKSLHNCCCCPDAMAANKTGRYAATAATGEP